MNVFPARDYHSWASNKNKKNKKKAIIATGSRRIIAKENQMLTRWGHRDARRENRTKKRAKKETTEEEKGVKIV